LGPRMTTVRQTGIVQMLFRTIRRLGGRVCRLGIRLRYIGSREPDNHPDVIAADALAHGTATDDQPIVLAFAYNVPIDKIDAYLRDPRVAGVVTKDEQADSYLPARLLHDPRVGRYWDPGDWSLPKDSTCIYLIGQWRLITLSMLRQALRQDIQRLYARCGLAWIDAIKIVRAADRLGLGRLYRLANRLCRGSLRRGGDSTRTTSGPAPLRPRLDAAFQHLLQPPLPADGAIFEPVAKRIVLVCGNLAPGGAERQVAYTIAGLASKPAESVLLLCDHLTPGERRYDFFLPQVRAAGGNARQIVTRVNPGRRHLLPPRLRQVASRLPSGLIADIANLYLEFIDLRPEVVHAWLDWSNIRAGIAAALAGVPRIILSGRNLNPSHFALYDIYMDPAYRALATLPNVALLNNSQAGANDYAEWIGIGPERIRVLRNGIDFSPNGRASDRQIAALRKQHGIPERAFVVGGAFRLAPEKQPLLWVETAALVRHQISDAHFIVFGQGPMKEDMEAMARSLGVADRLVLAGVTDQILSAMSMMDVFMLTSFGEGLPNVALEAQWVGTPVVATRAGGTGEAISQGITGWIVDEPTAAPLAAQVCRLYADDRLRLAVRDQGPAFVRSRFGLARMIDETWSAYGYAADEHPSEARPANQNPILG